MSGHNVHLPPEISTQILTKLPAKSLVRFRSGCKTWYSLISSPNFISDHSTQTLNKTTSNRVLVHRSEFGTGRSNLELSSHDESFVESHELEDLPEPCRGRGVLIGGYVEGLFCLCEIHAQRFVIWNPSIRKSVELPIPSSFSPSNSEVAYLVGFGFDRESSDYKVLTVVFHGVSAPVLVESQIFDLRKGVWRSLSLTMRPGLDEVPYPCTYLNGVLHWIRNDGFSDDFSLLYFNLSSEVFLEMGMPFRLEFEDDDEFVHHDTKLFPINGLLSVALLRRHWQGDDCQDWCSVWSMKGYGGIEPWTKLFHIKFHCNLTWHMRGLVRCWENGEVLIRDNKDGRENKNALVLYNLESRESKVLLSTTGFILNVCYYTESLVLL